MDTVEKTNEALKQLYESFAYKQYKMSKFEEYDLYAGNKDLLASEGIITFTDTNGKLMALKPDVTLSIVRSAKEQAGTVSKVFYSENVYRISESSKTYKEIMQTGLECLGDLDDYSVLEVVLLAAKSLLKISDKAILSISLPSLISSAVESLGLGQEDSKKALALIESKNIHELAALTEGCDKKAAADLCVLAKLSGNAADVLEQLKELGIGEADTRILSLISESFGKTGLGDILRFDLSAECGTAYYSGIVLKGYIEGIPSPVLSGGRYDALARRMGKKYGAIGFALYMDLLEAFSKVSEPSAVESMLLYSEAGSAVDVLLKANELSEQGKRVKAVRAVKGGISNV